MRGAAYVVAPFLSFPNTQAALLTAPRDVTICSMPRPDGWSISRASIHLIDSVHLRTRQSPTKKEPLRNINISTSFINTPLFLPSTWGNCALVRRFG